MKRTLFDRIEALEPQSHNKPPNTPITYFNEELDATMQIIGNGLAVPLPMSIKEREAMMKKSSISRKP